jgi:hypothetical protein
MRFERHLLGLTAALMIGAPAWAIQRCELNGESVNPNNGHTTAGKSGVMRCTDEDGQVRRRDQTLRDGRFVGPVVVVLADGERREYSVNERGNRHGLARTFDGKGTLRKEENLDNGSNVGARARSRCTANPASLRAR